MVYVVPTTSSFSVEMCGVTMDTFSPTSIIMNTSREGFFFICVCVCLYLLVCFNACVIIPFPNY